MCSLIISYMCMMNSSYCLPYPFLFSSSLCQLTPFFTNGFPTFMALKKIIYLYLMYFAFMFPWKPEEDTWKPEEGTGSLELELRIGIRCCMGAESRSSTRAVSVHNHCIILQPHIQGFLGFAPQSLTRNSM